MKVGSPEENNSSTTNSNGGHVCMPCGLVCACYASLALWKRRIVTAMQHASRSCHPLSRDLLTAAPAARACCIAGLLLLVCCLQPATHLD
jgi:hypothetical protein